MNDIQPVFIIGAGRSGTKFLRDTLFASKECTRIPYDVGYIWRYGNESLEHDEIDARSISDKQMDWIRSNLFKLIDKDNPRLGARYVIEKSVPNSLRPTLIHKCFPKAKIIQIIREGHAVTESAMRMWKQPPERGYLLDKLRYFPWSNYKYGIWFVKNNFFRIQSDCQPLWGPLYRGIQEDVVNMQLHEVCAKQWLKCVEIAQAQLSELPHEQHITIRYQDLMNTESTLERVCQFIGIDSRPVIDFWGRTVKRNNDEKWRLGLSAVQIADIDTVFSKMSPELRRYT